MDRETLSPEKPSGWAMSQMLLCDPPSLCSRRDLGADRYFAGEADASTSTGTGARRCASIGANQAT